MKDRPAAGGITFRMVELLAGKQLTTNSDILNYYCVVTGELTARSDSDVAVAGEMQDIIQLRGASMILENTGSKPLTMAHFMIDAESEH